MPKSKKQILTGGVSSACALQTTNLGKYMYRSCLDSNLHNRDPVANLELAAGAGFLPGVQTGGVVNGKKDMSKIKKYNKRRLYAQVPPKMKGKKAITGGFGCPTSARSSITFREYLEQAAQTIGAGKSTLTGGSGYVVNPGMGIAGLPEILKYDSCCPPAMIGKSIVMDPVGSTCGSLAQTGGSVGQVPVDSMEYSANKISVNSKLINMPSTKSNKRNRKSKRHTKKSRMMRKHTLRGGTPANYPQSLNGEPGDFRYKGSDLTYDGRQPFWSTRDR